MGLIGSPQLLDASAKKDEGYNKSYTRTYLVYATTDVDEDYVLAHLGVDIFSLHPSNRRAICKGIDLKLHHPHQATYDSIANPGGGPPPPPGTRCLVWVAAVEYGPWNPQDHTATGQPQDQPARVEFEGVVYEEIVDLDINGNPIVNAAGDAFDPPVTRDRTRPAIRVIRNELTFSDSTILAYADKINSDAFYSYPAKSLKVAAPRGVPKYSQFSDLNYFEVAYELHFNPKTWTKKVINQGFRELKTISGATRQAYITDGQGQPISSPYMLDAAGRKLTPPVAAGNIVELAFDIYEPLDFTSAFGFPTGLLR